MSKKETVKAASNPNIETVIDTTVAVGSNAKAFYQRFTRHFFAILLIYTFTLSIMLMLLYQQNKQSQVIITEQLVPLKTQLLQQTYLINANKIIDEIFQNANAQHFITLQQELSLQNKKLSLLNTEHKNSYQQWFSKNNVATKLVADIKSNQDKYEPLTNKALIQLDTLLDAIEIQLKKFSSDSNTGQILIQGQQQLMAIEAMLQRLNLQSSLEDLEQLQIHIDDMFVADYGKTLAQQKNYNEAITDIVRDFIRLKDLVLKHGLLTKWQGQLRLINGYQQQLITEQQQIQKILDGFYESIQNSDISFNNIVAVSNKAIVPGPLPLWLWLISVLTLVSIAALLWVIRLRIKTSSQYGLEYISRALESESTLLLNDAETSRVGQQKKALVCSELEQLALKIQQLNISSYSKKEYLALTQEYQTLADELVKYKAKEEQLKLAVVEFDASEKSTAQLLFEQKSSEELHLAVIRQLILLGQISVTPALSASAGNATRKASNYLYHAHLQGRELVRKLRQASYYRYLQSNDAVLTLSDVNLAGEVQAVLLNLRNTLIIDKNRASLTIDTKILTAVNLDAELFSEIFSVFIRLLFAQQTGQKLELKLQLVDKNNGQQKICFSGQVQGNEQAVKLPQSLQYFNDESTEKTELGDYFNTLLRYQHGEDVNAKLTEEGYQFVFTLPLAVTNNKQQQIYPVMALPENLAEIETVNNKLAVKYIVMPIEVLLAVKSPDQYQRLQQLLQAMGLQVSFVTSELMLHNHWHSGRFSVLMTEIPCTPFSHFITDDSVTALKELALPRGVFSLDCTLSLATPEDEFSLWNLGGLTAECSVDKLISAMLPWIKEQDCGRSATEKVAEVSHGSDSDVSATTVDKLASITSNKTQSFNFERYLKHQGSAELAIFMLDEYTAENTELVDQLSQAFVINDVKEADVAIQALLVNSKILAADNLSNLCQHWRKLLSNQGLNSSDKTQVNLLTKTKQAVADISQHADAVA